MADFGPTSAKSLGTFGQSRPNLAGHGPNSGRLWPKVVQCRGRLGHSRPMFCCIRLQSTDPVWPIRSRLYATHASVSSSIADVRRHLLNLGQASTQFETFSTASGAFDKRWPEVCHHFWASCGRLRRRSYGGRGLPPFFGPGSAEAGCGKAPRARLGSGLKSREGVAAPFSSTSPAGGREAGGDGNGSGGVFDPWGLARHGGELSGVRGTLWPLCFAWGRAARVAL